MSTLEEQIDVEVPVQVAWEQLHRVHQYPAFVAGLRHAHPHGSNRAHCDIEVGGTERVFETAISDHGENQVMNWQTLDAAHLRGTFALRSLDNGSTRVQVRVEYDPEAVHEVYGGPHGFAQSHAIEETVRGDLAQFKRLVEEERPLRGS
ncbi:SRPBCC family protein [Kitasatospora sp. NPDC008050]|uniref:SRPBCC family protein n=1 Tax=Kitasatospora sp. NPDC008050 TaxID=3364021 RepID=UPI0036EC599F